jgi:hypothetical protein
MPTVVQHLAKVCSNKKLLGHLGEATSTAFPDWFVTAAFYTAVHAVEAILCQEVQLHAKHHDERELFLRTKLPAIDKKFLGAYRELYVKSREARYMTNRKFSMDHADCELAMENLDVIETECKETYFPDYPNP